MSVSRVLVPIALFAATGCSLYHRDALLVDPTPRVATVVDSVRVLAQEPAHTYKVVALVSVSSYAVDATLRDLSHALAVEAAKLGANGLIVGPESFSQTKDQRTLTGRAIVFDSTAPPAAPLEKVGQGGTGQAIVLSAMLCFGLIMTYLAAIDDEEPRPVSLP